MSEDIHEIYAVAYGSHPRMRSENYVFGDPHDEMTPFSYYVWVIKGPQGTYVVDTGFDEAAETIVHPACAGHFGQVVKGSHVYENSPKIRENRPIRLGSVRRSSVKFVKSSIGCPVALKSCSRRDFCSKLWANVQAAAWGPPI